MIICGRRNTTPERALRSMAHRAGMRYRVSARPLPGIRRTADLLFTRAKVAVFVDGCFWHACPDHYSAPRTNSAYWGPKIERNRVRDRETDRLLEQAGWRVVRIWEHQVTASALDSLVVAVADAVAAGLGEASMTADRMPEKTDA